MCGADHSGDMHVGLPAPFRLNQPLIEFTSAVFVHSKIVVSGATSGCNDCEHVRMTVMFLWVAQPVLWESALLHRRFPEV